MKNSKEDAVKNDPVLDTTMKTILALMEMHKIGGYLILVSKSHSRYSFHMPKWTKVHIDEAKDQIRMLCKREDFTSQELWADSMEDMVHFVHQMRDLSRTCFKTFEMLVARLGEYLEVNHGANKGRVDGPESKPDE